MRSTSPVPSRQRHGPGVVVSRRGGSGVVVSRRGGSGVVVSRRGGVPGQRGSGAGLRAHGRPVPLQVGAVPGRCRCRPLPFAGHYAVPLVPDGAAARTRGAGRRLTARSTQPYRMERGHTNSQDGTLARDRDALRRRPSSALSGCRSATVRPMSEKGCTCRARQHNLRAAGDTLGQGTMLGAEPWPGPARRHRGPGP